MNKLRLWALASAFCVLGTTAHAQVQPIGSQLQVTSNPSAVSSQGAYLGYNRLTLGETDFFTSPGGGVGGYIWYNGTEMTQIMPLTYQRLLSTTLGFSGPLTGNVTGNLTGIVEGGYSGTFTTRQVTSNPSSVSSMGAWIEPGNPRGDGCLYRVW